MSQPNFESTSIQVLEKNELYWVINKPAGLAVHNGPLNLIDLLEKQVGERFHPVHRLDRETSGLILLARGSKATALLQKTLSSENSKKEYLAIIRGQITNGGKWTMPISSKAEGRQNPAGKNKERVTALTQYEVLDHNQWLSLISCTLHTGRQHQIRKHAALAKHHIIGDKRYGDPKYVKMITKRYQFSGLALHAQRLSFHLKGKDQTFEAPMPSSWHCFELNPS